MAAQIVLILISGGPTQHCAMFDHWFSAGALAMHGARKSVNTVINLVFLEYSDLSTKMANIFLMVILVCLRITLHLYHSYAGVSEGIGLLKCQVHSVKCVSKIKSILSVIFHAMCSAVCSQLTHLSCDNCENTCTLSYHHHQIGSINHCLGLVHEIMVHAYLSIFLYHAQCEY